MSNNNLQTPKEKFDEQEVKKLEDDVQKTEAMQKFNEVVKEFCVPSLEIIFPNDDELLPLHHTGANAFNIREVT